MDETFVRAGLVENPRDYQWTNTSAHLKEKDDDLVNVSPLLERAGDWRDFLSEDISEQERDVLYQYETAYRDKFSLNDFHIGVCCLLSVVIRKQNNYTKIADFPLKGRDSRLNSDPKPIFITTGNRPRTTDIERHARS